MHHNERMGSSTASEIRAVATLVSAHARRVAQRGVLVGDDVPVLLVPGLMAGDWVMSHIALQLEQRGHPTLRARIGVNIGCTRELVERLEARLDAAAGRCRRRVAIVGWSRGGCLAKIVALRRPALVASLTTLASPTVDPLAVSAKVERQIRVLAWMGSAGIPGVLGRDCLSGACADLMGAELRGTLPRDIPYTSFYSRDDGVVDWRACRDPGAELVEVSGSHLTVGTNPVVVEGIAERLRRLVPRAA